MIGFVNWTVEANSAHYLHTHWLTGSFGKGAMPDGDGRAGGEENCCEEGVEREKKTLNAFPMMYGRYYV